MASKRKETYLPQGKYFEGNDHWHCRYITFSSHLQFFKVGKIMAWANYGHLMLPAVFPDKVTPDSDFKNEAVV